MMLDNLRRWHGGLSATALIQNTIKRALWDHVRLHYLVGHMMIVPIPAKKRSYLIVDNARTV